MSVWKPCTYCTLLYADTSVQLDANNMMAGQALIFELMLVGIDPVKT